MCPFCISTVVGIAAGTVTTAGMGALFAFTHRLKKHAETTAPDQSEEGEV